MINSVSSNKYNPSFGAGYHMYFYATDGSRIISEQNMKKCLHYVEAHLNGSKRVKVHNQDLINTMKFGQILPSGKRLGGDKDYFYYPKIRAVFDKEKTKSEGFINVLTGKDVDVVNKTYGKPIGKAKRMSIEKTGSSRSFETLDAVSRYAKNAPEYAEQQAVYRDGKRMAFGVCFEPQYKKNGELKGFQFHHAGFFPEDKVV